MTCENWKINDCRSILSECHSTLRIPGTEEGMLQVEVRHAVQEHEHK